MCKSGPKARSKDVADGQQVDIPVLRYIRNVGTQKESGAGKGKTEIASTGGEIQANPYFNPMVLFTRSEQK